MDNITTAPSLTYKIPKSGANTAFVLFLPLYASLVAGTGGIYQASNLLDSSVFRSNPLIKINENRRRSTSVTSVSHHINKIRSAFGLNMSEMAEVFGVSRPTAYSWLQGSSPKHDLLSKIWRLSSYADSLAALGIPRMQLLVRRPLRSGVSLFAALQAGNGIDSAIDCIKELAEDMNNPLAELRERTARKARVHFAEEISVPLIDRD